MRGVCGVYGSFASSFTILTAALALALVFLRAVFDDRIFDTADLNQFGFDPILTVVPAPGDGSGSDA